MTSAEWEVVVKALDARLTETIDALVDAAAMTGTAASGTQWEHWRSLTNYRLPDFRERKAAS